MASGGEGGRGLGEHGIRLMGIINLITSFPQLASAMLIVKHAKSPWEEFRLREWPDPVLDNIRVALSRMTPDLYEAVMDALVSSDMFVENFTDIVFHDAAVGRVSAAPLYNYLSALRDFGFTIAQYTECLDPGFTRRVLSLTGSSLDELRVADVAFVYGEPATSDEDEVEPEDETYEYICSPSWVKRATEKLLRVIRESRGAPEPGELAGLVKGVVDEGNIMLYTYLRVLAFYGARRAFDRREHISILPGELRDLKGVLDVGDPYRRPAFNYAASQQLREAFRLVESQLLSAPPNAPYSTDHGVFKLGDAQAAPAHALPSLVIGGFRGRLRVEGEREWLEASKSIASSMGVSLKVEEDRGAVKVTVGAD